MTDRIIYIIIIGLKERYMLILLHKKMSETSFHDSSYMQIFVKPLH